MNKFSLNLRSYTSLATIAALTAASWGLARTAIAAPVTRVYVVEVSPAKDNAFREGVVAWHSCERANGERSKVLVYDAETGDVSRYAFLEGYSSWAGMDRKNPAAKACAALFRDGVLPNVKAAYSDVMLENPKITWMPAADPGPAPMLWVDAFRIKPGQGDDFHAGLEKFAAAAVKTHWSGHFTGYDVIASGEGGEDFLIVGTDKDWAGTGAVPKPSIKQLMISVYGRSAAKANHKRFYDSVAEEWFDVWSYDKKLSSTPKM
jgi:hypothetical protein